MSFAAVKRQRKVLEVLKEGNGVIEGGMELVDGLRPLTIPARNS
jgi:hypothetical protein